MVPKQQLHEIAAKNIEQARTAYGQLMDAMTLGPSEAMISGFKAVQERAIKFAKKKAEVGFALANDSKEPAGRHQTARKQMESYARQARAWSAHGEGHAQRK